MSENSMKKDKTNGCAGTPDNYYDLSTVDTSIMEEERRNFRQVLAAFKLYSQTSTETLNQRESFFNTLPERHKEYLANYRNGLTRVRDAIESNYRVIREILASADQIFLNDDTTYSDRNGTSVELIRGHDIEKVQVTLKQIARDWSSDGELEREQCYKPIIQEIIRHFDPDKVDVGQVKVLVPGAGLGRLMYELAYIGYFCEGNEFSLFMLLTSNFILNRCLVTNEHTIYPYVHQYVNNLNRNDQTKSLKFPDPSPTQRRPKNGSMNMVAGDFLEVYQEEDSWDCVATCFFIDCANNVVEFIETIFKILKPGCIWVNLGPLLYHYSAVPGEHSIEPSFEDIKGVCEAVGFEFLKCETDVKTSYSQNPQSMMKSEYSSVLFVCRKPSPTEDNENMTL